MLNNVIIPTDESADSPTVLAESPAAPINLWLVDDNHRMRATLTEILGRCDGIKCTAAFASPNHVLSALASKVGPDVILLDVHMGDLNGLDAIRPIKSLSRSTQVLMLTTFFDSESQSRALTAGASGFLLKSFPIETILNSIREARRKPAPHLKRRCLQNSSFPPEAKSRPEIFGRTPASRETGSVGTEASRKRLLWVKHCLDMIRNIRNCEAR
ncbi:MAG: response regulator transcription factor [Akkermansiaceae bacterium]|nr:response regulator transcription factor [Verrucomicrobiales bacterium]